MKWIFTKEMTISWLVPLIIVFGILIYADYVNPKDDTDPVDSRSGFRLMIDSGTGCQYLQAGYFGGMTPRLNRNGNHICK